MEFSRITERHECGFARTMVLFAAWGIALGSCLQTPVPAQPPVVDSDLFDTESDDNSNRDDPQPEKTDTQAEAIEYWVSQLGSDQYLRRRRASRWLIEAGPAAVPTLVDNLGNGDLEFTRRAIDVLQEVAFSQPPIEDGGAWGELQQLAESGVGSQASRALAAVEEIRDHRGRMAREVLASKGVYIGMADFVVRSSSTIRRIVQIDRKGDGNLDHLQWLRWVNNVSYARVVGEAVDPEVVEYLIRMPDLETIVFLDGEVDADFLSALAEIKQIRDLEFRYVPMNSDLADQLVNLPIRSSLSLMGTGMPAETVEEMRAARPGLQIEHRQGGFLGVSCPPDMNICQITGIVPNSAAEDAGLIPQDVIVGIGDREVTRFKDLQDAINEHLPGDEIKIRYSRGGVVQETTAKLGRMEQEIRGIPDR
jgi:hypothetical protein